MSSDAPEGWKHGRFGQFLKAAQGGGTPPRGNPAYWGRDLPWASVKDVTSGASEPLEHITAEGLANSSSRRVAAGTNILAMRMAVGSVVRYEMEVAINQDLLALVPADSLDPDFLFHWLRHHSPNFADVATGTTVKGLRKDILLDWPILLPPLDEQRRIAEVLRSVDDQIHLTKGALAATRAAKNATLIAALHVNSWPSVPVGDLLADTRIPMRSGPFGSALLKSELTDTGIPLLGIDNVHAERFVPEYRRFISEAKYQELARYTVFPNDVMVTIMGTVGRCCVVPECVGRAISSKHVWTITLDKARYSPALLAWQINHEPRVLEQLRGSAQGGIMSAISSETLRNLRVPQPPRAQMLELEQLIMSANSTISLLEAELTDLARLKHLVSGDLLSGHVRVPA